MRGRLRAAGFCVTAMAVLGAGCAGTTSETSSSSSGMTAGSSTSGGVASSQGQQSSTSSSSTTGGSTSLPGSTNYQDLVINEVSASGEDWVELLNVGTQGVQLYGLHMAEDESGMPSTFTVMDFPRLVLDAGARLVILGGQPVPAEGLQARCLQSGGPSQCLYALWDISNGTGDVMYLLAPDNTVLTQAAVPMDGAPTGTTWCRLPDATGNLGACSPTPGAVNAPAGSGSSSSGGGATSAQPSSSAAAASSSAGGTSSSAAPSSSAQPSSSAAASSSSSGAPAPTGVVINEVTSQLNDEIELFNNSGSAVDISGWTVLDSTAGSTAYTFPASTSMAAGDRVVLVRNTHHTFGLGSVDSVTLRDGANAIKDTVSWTTAIASSLCRIPDGTGPFQTCTASFGSANTP